jgi:hypothetical protein
LVSFLELNKEEKNVYACQMDDYRYFAKAIKPLRTPFTVDKDAILKITSQLLEREIYHETLQETFCAYVEACMEYSLKKDAPAAHTGQPYPCDDLLLPPKKISTFVTKKNINPFHYVKNAQSNLLSGDQEADKIVLQPIVDVRAGERVEPALPTEPREGRRDRVSSTRNGAVRRKRRTMLLSEPLEPGRAQKSDENGFCP